MESWNAQTFSEATGVQSLFVQDNHSRSRRGVLRGLHYQLDKPQAKLVRVVSGRVFDVAVDLRRHSAYFGKWIGVELTEENHRMLWLPEGFAHGFMVLSEVADFLYKTTNYYHPASDRTLLWNDPEVGVEWPLHALDGEPLLSSKDTAGVRLACAEVYA